MRRVVVAVLTVALLAGVSCAASDVTGGRRTVGGVTMTFTVDPAQVQVGQPIRLTLRLSNNTGIAQELSFPTAQLYDFWVTRDGREVWRWSEGMAFAQQVTGQSIPGQTSVSFGEAWTAETSGTFRAHGLMTAQGYGDALSGEVVVR